VVIILYVQNSLQEVVRESPSKGWGEECNYRGPSLLGMLRWPLMLRWDLEAMTCQEPINP